MSFHVDEAVLAPSAPSDRIANLENHYVALLESRIAQLENRGVSGDGNIGASSSKKVPGAGLCAKSSDMTSDDVKKAKRSKKEANQKVSESRYRTVIRKWVAGEGVYKDIDTTSLGKEKRTVSKKGSGRAFTFRILTGSAHRSSYYQSHGEFVSSEVDIESKPLGRLLGKLTSKWGWNDTVITCRSPYLPLLYSWDDALRETKIVGPDSQRDQARIDLERLLELLSTSSGPPLDQYFRNRDTFIAEGSITHSALCTLFPPGTLIIFHDFLNQPQIFSVQSCNGFNAEDQIFTLICYSFDWNGYVFNRVPFAMRIPYWGSDRRSIAELPFYPLNYYIEIDVAGNSTPYRNTKLEERLIERGKRFVQICKDSKPAKMFDYAGEAYVHTGRSLVHEVESDGEECVGSSGAGTSNPDYNSSGNDGFVSIKRVKGTTLVDFVSFYEHLPEETPTLGSKFKYYGAYQRLTPKHGANQTFRAMHKFDWDKHPLDKLFTREQYMMCPPRVLGYELKRKRWAQLLVDELSDCADANSTTFRDKLQLDDDLKELLEKLVKAHECGKDYNKKGQTMALQDFAPDKGKGLTILLYGYPGVGKTLTAESVAMMAGKPLISVGVSDIGVAGDRVEANLQKIFNLAGKWKAILLIDEADVFLEARGGSQNHLRRNAMVSVLLRILEYYDGILILTTNRMRSFDVAVQSRIHLAIKYDDLTKEQQAAIFGSFLEQLHEKRLVANLEDLKSWVNKEGCKYGFNGRQIRNIVSTAMGIARTGEYGKSGQLTREHLIQVADQTRQFKADLSLQEAVYKQQMNQR